MSMARSADLLATLTLMKQSASRPTTTDAPSAEGLDAQAFSALLAALTTQGAIGGDADESEGASDRRASGDDRDLRATSVEQRVPDTNSGAPAPVPSASTGTDATEPPIAIFALFQRQDIVSAPPTPTPTERAPRLPGSSRSRESEAVNSPASPIARVGDERGAGQDDAQDFPLAASRPSAENSLPLSSELLPQTHSHESDGRVAPPVKLTVTALETHLPAAISHMLTSSSLPREGEERTGAAAIVHHCDAPRQIAAPLKILTFELEPGDLGAVTVKMRMTREKVDLDIVVQSETTLSMLNELRDKLASAVSNSGCKVESLDIRVSQTLASPDMRQNSSDGGNQRAPERSDAGGDGLAGNEGFGEQRRHRGYTAQQPASKTRSPRDSGDRRGRLGGVYL